MNSAHSLWQVYRESNLEETQLDIHFGLKAIGRAGF